MVTTPSADDARVGCRWALPSDVHANNGFTSWATGVWQCFRSDDGARRRARRHASSGGTTRRHLLHAVDASQRQRLERDPPLWHSFVRLPRRTAFCGRCTIISAPQCLQWEHGIRGALLVQRDDHLRAIVLRRRGTGRVTNHGPVCSARYLLVVAHLNAFPHPTGWVSICGVLMAVYSWCIAPSSGGANRPPGKRVVIDHHPGGMSTGSLRSGASGTPHAPSACHIRPNQPGVALRSGSRVWLLYRHGGVNGPVVVIARSMPRIPR